MKMLKEYMKTLNEYLREVLRGEVEVIDATDFRRHIGETLTQASIGKSFCIKRKGRIVAFLVPPENAPVVHEILPDGSAPTLNLADREADHK